MKKKSLVCLAFLCFLMSFMGVGCSATRESTDSSVSKAHEDTQITEHTGHGAESSTKAETEEPILQTVIIQQVRDHSITVEHIVLLNSYDYYYFKNKSNTKKRSRQAVCLSASCLLWICNNLHFEKNG